MRNYLKKILLSFLFYSLYSCTPSAPYEAKSPCAADPFTNPYAITPCNRIPANLGYIIS